MNKKKRIIRSTKKSKAAKKETNSTAHRKMSVSIGGQHDCFICPPWKGDNQVGASKAKRGSKKPKYKNKR
jgi:hypothetical protein